MLHDETWTEYDDRWVRPGQAELPDRIHHGAYLLAYEAIPAGEAAGAEQGPATETETANAIGDVDDPESIGENFGASAATESRGDPGDPLLPSEASVAARGGAAITDRADAGGQMASGSEGTGAGEDVSMDE